VSCNKDTCLLPFLISLASLSELLSLRVTALHPPLILSALAIVAAYLYTRHWVSSNVLALSLSLSSISMLSLDSFQTGSIMLTGLFLYDIFWVFGTNVMVSVARGFDGPIKIVWPKNFAMGLLQKDTKWQMTMLGLGDIVIPGIFIALALRFDQHRYIKANPSKLITKKDLYFAKPYFQATLIAYVVGLAVTMGVMHFTKAAQPALLYLSPACISAVGLCAFRRGEFKEMWAWKDEEEEKDEDKKKAEAKETKSDEVVEKPKATKSTTRRRKSSMTK
jgi:minor histocompatibility antigen H13